MGKYIAYCSYYESPDSDVLHEVSRECSSEEEAQNALNELTDAVSDGSLLDEFDVFEKEYCVFDGAVWKPTDMAFIQRDGAILYNERLRMIEAYKVRFVCFLKRNGFWFAHISEHPEAQQKMDEDCSYILNIIAQRARDNNSMDFALAGEYPYDDYAIRLTMIQQDEFGAMYKMMRGHHYLPEELENKNIWLGTIPKKLFDNYPPHIDILEIR